MPEVYMGHQGVAVKIAKILASMVGLAVAVALYLWDDVFFSWPILTISTLWGAIPAILILVPFYTAVDFLLSLAVIWVYDKVSQGRENKFELWLKKISSEEANTKRTKSAKWVVSLLSRDGWIRRLGFVLASFTLGGFTLTLIIRYSGKREGIVQTAFWAAFIFAATFVPFYAGLPRLIINLF